MPRDPKDDVLQIKLSEFHSIDVVRLPIKRIYRIVFAERFGVQRRAFVELSFEDAREIGKFLVSIDNPPALPAPPLSPPPPPEVQQMIEQYVTEEAAKTAAGSTPIALADEAVPTPIEREHASSSRLPLSPPTKDEEHTDPEADPPKRPMWEEDTDLPDLT